MRGEVEVRVAFLNLVHCDPGVVARTTKKLTEKPGFDMFIHIDAKVDAQPFYDQLNNVSQVYFVEDRKTVYWGGFHAIEATIALLKLALSQPKEYDYFVLFQNLDYPIRSNDAMEEFFVKHQEKEFIRGCKIGQIRDWHYQRKYKIYNKRDDDFYLSNPSKLRRIIHNLGLGIRSIPTIGFSGVIKENQQSYCIYYGAAQWAVTRTCAKYFVDFYETHPKFNRIMSHIQFPDEEYFHTIVHNTDLKYRCIRYNEPIQRWLVNWRNIHYFEYPKEVTVFTEKDFDRLMKKKELFCRKVRSGVSDELMNKIDEVTKTGECMDE